ncbi:MAG: transglutaminase domain-containing protein, partial [Nocardioides sp.]|uniref:transglutaminase-like domain-containing protein n=1 Tax=Nocardioides sp. TaxID=35761 RepID=UPI0039E565B7
MGELVRRSSRSAVATLVAGLTAWTATLSWQVLALDQAPWIRGSAVLLAVVVVTGALARVWLGALLTLTAQLLAGLATLSWQLSGGPVPVGGRMGLLVQEFHDAVELSLHVRPPAPVAGGVLPLLLAGTLLALLVIDLLAVGLGRPALAGVGVVGIWVVTFWNGPVTPPWWQVAAPAAGLCLLLLLQHHATLARWGGGFARRFAITGLGVGAVAVAAAVVVPMLVHAEEFDTFDFGSGSGRGGGLSVTNPMVDMQGQLTQGADEDLLEVTTDDPSPSYLRLTVLTQFRDSQWTPGDRSVPSTHTASGAMPALTGVDDALPRTTYDYRVHATRALTSTWLPTQAPITSIVADGDWRYDATTMDFLAADDGLSTRNATWRMTGATLDLTSQQLLDMGTSTVVGSRFVDLPADFPDEVTEMAEQLTAAARTPFAKAVALQRWFRSGGGFVYDTSVDLGNGVDDLVTFLSDEANGRRGFCQQFASAMAAMARSLGIPARVAVGFLRPEHTGTDTWVYSTHDLHAWPELYFQGAGWVRFEPTPAARAATVPDYTEEVDEQDPADAPSASPTTAPTQEPVEPSQRPRDDESPAAAGAQESHAG